MHRARTSLLLASTLAAAVVAALVPPAVAQEASPSPSATASPAASPTASATATVGLRLTASVPTVLAGENVVLSGRATGPAGMPLAGEQLDVVSRTGGTTVSTVIGRVTTDADGVAALTWKPRTSSEYLLRRAVDPATSSDRRVVQVQPRLSGTIAPASVVVGSAATLRGALAPAYLGSRLQVQRRLADGSWRGVAMIGTDGAGVYSYRLVATSAGRQVYRVVLGVRQAYLGAASAPVALTVLADPTLRQGASGAAVRTLENLLLRQKGDVGRVDGVFDADLRHALTAFQKSQGLSRTGVYDVATRRRLSAPTAVRLRYPAAGRAVEIDLTKQVLYLSQGGVLQRVVDISSGNDQNYVSEGVTYKAFTPVGRFSIQRKIDGIRVSRLGELYRPAYFVQGWAIHGSPSVPTYPASHGCIRVTNSSQDRLFPLLTVSTPVSVYRS